LNIAILARGNGLSSDARLVEDEIPKVLDKWIWKRIQIDMELTL
jgi:hypothetical protein